MTHPDELLPWQWPEEIWRGKVEQVRAGRNLKPARWKNGARCAVALSFDVDHETNELRDGGKSVGRLSWGQYGNRVGVPRILKLLKRQDIPASFFVPAVTALLHPDEQRQIVGEGHEIGLHGWIHEVNTAVPPADERELHLRSADTLEKVSGVRPVGMRTPSWDFSDVTPRSSANSACSTILPSSPMTIPTRSSKRVSRPASSSCQSNGSATTRPISV